jgi:hypothetical protein
MVCPTGWTAIRRKSRMDGISGSGGTVSGGRVVSGGVVEGTVAGVVEGSVWDMVGATGCSAQAQRRQASKTIGMIRLDIFMSPPPDS